MANTEADRETVRRIRKHMEEKTTAPEQKIELVEAIIKKGPDGLWSCTRIRNTGNGETAKGMKSLEDAVKFLLAHEGVK